MTLSHRTIGSCYVVAAIAGYGMFVLPFLLTVELLPGEHKTAVSMMINFPFVLGETLMCGIAWLTRDYRIVPQIDPSVKLYNHGHGY